MNERTYVIDIAVTRQMIHMTRSTNGEKDKNVYVHLHGIRKDHQLGREICYFIIKKEKKSSGTEAKFSI